MGVGILGSLFAEVIMRPKQEGRGLQELFHKIEVGKQI